MATLKLIAPLAGWCLPINEVPDPVFAQRMVGEGVAIDPTGSLVHAPCAGAVVLMSGAKHAVTIRTELGIDVLLHVGIDTVALHGKGFELLVAAGDLVQIEQPLLRFDLDFVARHAKSVVTPIVLTGAGFAGLSKVIANRSIDVGEMLMEVAINELTVAQAIVGEQLQQQRRFIVPFEHGLHARPAALVVTALKGINAAVKVSAHGRSGNAHSAVSLMSLGIQRGDEVVVQARGTEASAAITVLERLLQPAPTRSASRTTAMETQHSAPLAKRMTECQLTGVLGSPGLAMGVAASLLQAERLVNETGSGYHAESSALTRARAVVRQHLEALIASGGATQRGILTAHLELLDDPELLQLADVLLQRDKSAAFAWRGAVRDTAVKFRALGDALIAERAADLLDLEAQVLRVLDGEPPVAVNDLPERAIIIAEELLPSELLTLDLSRVSGICMAHGGPTSHVAIIATAKGIPALVAIGSEVTAITNGTPLLLDADNGLLHVDPSAAELSSAVRALDSRAAERAADKAAAKGPCITADGVGIKVFCNLGALNEVADAVTHGAEGCGLLRTELLFMDRTEPPDEAEQLREYQHIATALAGRPLVIRTLDVGGDKPIPYLRMPTEENPALGMRGLRMSLHEPALLRTQLRAILRVEPFGQCRILLPMVTELSDVRTVRALLEEIATELGRKELPQLGAMIETPASALLADQLSREVEFLSIGSNDLSQYTLAMDRGHAELASRLDALHPAVLRLIAQTTVAAKAARCRVSVCGGLASDPVAIPILIGLGVQEISAVPILIPRLKRLIRGLDTNACVALAAQALNATDAAAVRALSEQWQRNTLRQPPSADGARLGVKR